MSESQPPKLEYPSAPQPAPPGRGPFVARQFLMGLALGTVFSAVVWIAGWDLLVDGNSLLKLLAVPAVKVVATLVLLCIRGWWSVGVGIAVSLTLGFLIFFGTCAAHVKF